MSKGPQSAATHGDTTPVNAGTVVSVRGNVVDARFDGHLPPIYSVLQAGTDKQIVIEVLAQPDAHSVRGIALTPTQGLARGMAVDDTGGPLEAPVGKAILSRTFDVFGHTIDRGAALSDVRWRSVHRAPPPLVERSTKSEIFETGIKVIDVLMPLERGGKAGLFGGAGVGTAERRGSEDDDRPRRRGAGPLSAHADAQTERGTHTRQEDVNDIIPTGEHHAGPGQHRSHHRRARSARRQYPERCRRHSQPIQRSHHARRGTPRQTR